MFNRDELSSFESAPGQFSFSQSYVPRAATTAAVHQVPRDRLFAFFDTCTPIHRVEAPLGQSTFVERFVADRAPVVVQTNEDLGSYFPSGGARDFRLDIIAGYWSVYPLVPTELPLRARRFFNFNRFATSETRITWLHHDGTDNIFFNVHGIKVFVIFDTEQHPCLYHAIGLGGVQRASPVSIDNCDLHRFPRFAEAKPYIAVLGEGDILYMPSNWSHQVYTFADASRPSLAYNAWFFTSPRYMRRKQLPGLKGLIAHAENLGMLLIGGGGRAAGSIAQLVASPPRKRPA